MNMINWDISDEVEEYGLICFDLYNEEEIWLGTEWVLLLNRDFEMFK